MCCPLVWMSHSTDLKHKINRVHERGHDTTTSLEKLLQKDNSVSIHHRNIQVLTTEMFRVLQQDISKNYDGCLPTERTFEL